VPILPTYGTRQRARYHHHDVVVRGLIDDLVPPGRMTLRLNGGPPRAVYVEQTSDVGTDWVNGYKSTPAELRCRDLGEFCVEIPVDDPALRPGPNRLDLVSEDAAGHRHACAIELDWDPAPVKLPLDLSDLSRVGNVQDIGMALNGAFDVDSRANVIRSRAPVAPDAFLVVGSPHASQEATFAVRFLEPLASKWLGLSDFMAGQTEGVPQRGLKVGWSSAGMAALSPRDGARSFIAWGDHSGSPEEWAIATHPAAPFAVEPRRLYRVRHRIDLGGAIDRVRFRIWPADATEPDTWLCQEQDDAVPAHLPRHKTASFGLFQHLGLPVEWSDIRVVALDSTIDPPIIGRGRMPFLRRVRPGAF
jgi:hypothetical protein